MHPPLFYFPPPFFNPPLLLLQKGIYLYLKCILKCAYGSECMLRAWSVPSFSTFTLQYIRWLPCKPKEELHENKDIKHWPIPPGGSDMPQEDGARVVLCRGPPSAILHRGVCRAILQRGWETAYIGHLSGRSSNGPTSCRPGSVTLCGPQLPHRCSNICNHGGCGRHPHQDIGQVE